MLSINIPVYNIVVTELIQELSKQARSAGIDYEIRIYDDCSEKKIKLKNRKLQNQDNIIYQEMPKNFGRSALRNKMGFDSLNKFLLFIDSDSEIHSKSYIDKYIKFAAEGSVVCGGTAYKTTKPDRPEEMLRWVYGTNREAITANIRSNSKRFIITSNNFLIDRSVFQKSHFSERIGPYGHEDTLLGFHLYQKGITVKHIDNPVLHTGLEDSSTFLQKTRNALENLKLITEAVVDDADEFSKQVKFLQQYNLLIKVFPEILLSKLFSVIEKSIEKNLTGINPLLLFFDLYKAGYYSTLKTKH